MHDEIFSMKTTPKTAWKWALVIDGRRICLATKPEHLEASRKRFGGEIVPHKPEVKPMPGKKRRFAR